MKVLFVCGGNVSRSQMAEAFFNKMSCERPSGHYAISAGTRVGEYDGDPLPSRSVIKCMGEWGYDLGECERRQLKPELVRGTDETDNAGMIVSFVGEEALPDYARGPKTRYWDHLEDPKRFGDEEPDPERRLELYRQVRDEIEGLVKGLVEEIG